MSNLNEPMSYDELLRQNNILAKSVRNCANLQQKIDKYEGILETEGIDADDYDEEGDFLEGKDCPHCGERIEDYQ